MRAMRAYWRQRAAWLADRAAPSQPRQQARPQMTVQCTQVLTDITGAPGLAMSRAMVAGERDPVRLARVRAPGWARRTEDIAQAWTGPDHPEPVLALTPALALSDASTEPGRAGEAALERRFQALTPVGPAARPPRNRANTHRTHHTKAPADDAAACRIS